MFLVIFHTWIVDIISFGTQILNVISMVNSLFISISPVHYYQLHMCMGGGMHTHMCTFLHPSHQPMLTGVWMLVAVDHKFALLYS